MADINVTLGGDARGLASTIESVKSKVGGLQKILAGISVGAFLKSIVDDMNKIDDIASNLDISTDFVQELQRAADLGGSSLDMISEAFKKMSLNVAVGDEKVKGSLSKLGLSFEEIRVMDPEQAFKLVAERINSLPTYMDKATISAGILGESSKNLIDVMSKMSEINPFDKYKAEDIRAVTEASDALAVSLKNIQIFTASNFMKGINFAADVAAGAIEGVNPQAIHEQRQAEEKKRQQDEAKSRAERQKSSAEMAKLDEVKTELVKESKIDIPKLVDVQVGDRQAGGLYEAGFSELRTKFTEQTKAIDVAKQQLSTLKRIETKLENQNNSFIVRD